jgi:hypothetical protein
MHTVVFYSAGEVKEYGRHKGIPIPDNGDYVMIDGEGFQVFGRKWVLGTGVTVHVFVETLAELNRAAEEQRELRRASRRA